MNGMNFFDGEKKSNLVHYEGELGVFDYDPREFEIKKFYDGTKCLHYCGNGKSVDLPDGCIDTRYMFCRRRLPEGFSLGERFDTSKVTDMYGMFSYCKLPEGFSLGEHFNTSNVTDMSYMFNGCSLPDGFSLGEYFNTSNVTDMSSMFEGCEILSGSASGQPLHPSKASRSC